jgi:uncharacterized protein YjdB
LFISLGITIIYYWRVFNLKLMKKRSLLIVAASALLVLAACQKPVAGSSSVTPAGSSSNTPTSSTPTSTSSTPTSVSSSDSTIAITDLTVDATASVKVGETFALTIAVLPADATEAGFTCETSDTGVCTVTNAGVITGVAAGSANVTVTSKGKKADGTAIVKTVAVTVIENATALKDITASGTYDVKAVVAAVTKKGYILDDGTGAAYVFSTLASGYAFGDYVFANVTVAPFYGIWEISKVNKIAKATGTAPTLATPAALTTAMIDTWVANPGSKTETTAPIATKDMGPFTFNATAKIVNGFTQFTIEGSTVALQPNALPDNIEIFDGVNYDVVAYTGGYNSSYKYVTLYVASVTPKYTTLTGLAINGNATMSTGATMPLTVTTTPAGADPHVTWASSDATVASVDETGLVTAIKEGSVTITATSTAVTTVKATLALTITKPVVTVSVAAFDFTTVPTAPTTSPYGKLDATSALALFTATTYLKSGTNPVTAVTPTNAYQADITQGPKKNGIKVGASSATGSLVFTLSSDIVKVTASFYAWGTSKLATVTMGGVDTALVAADVTAAHAISASFAATKSFTLSTSKYCIMTSIEFFGAQA